MKITFLGTSAANAFPEAFCRCQNCEQARRLGGASLRKRSSLLINDDLLVDLGPDIMTASQLHAVSLTKVRYCLQTHPHADHLDLSHLLSRSPESGTRFAPRLHFFASELTLQSADRIFAQDLAGFPLLSPQAGKRLNLRIHPVAPCRRYRFGRYSVTPFLANHDPMGGALLYAVESGDSRIFYAADTASLLESTWQDLRASHLCFDLLVLDHTYGPGQEGNDHLSARGVVETMVRMRNEGLLTSTARVFATHIAHEGNPAHPELVRYAGQHGYEIACDGLVIDI